jgi:Na+-translocating ferredoxin:NAD+ oxidoreductase RnfG subunit
MLRLLQTKILLAILAALATLASAAIYQQHEAHKAAVLREQERQRDEQFRRQVEQNKKQHNSTAGKEGNTWRSYIP